MEKFNFNKKEDVKTPTLVSVTGEELSSHKLNQQNLEDIKNGKTPGSKEKYKVGIVDISSSMESQAEDIAEARMSKDKKNTNLFSRFWKHNIARAAYKQAYLIKARKDIMESGNLYAGETGDAIKDIEIGEETKKGIIGRYLEEYEGQEFGKGIQTEAGEFRKKIESKSPEEILAKEKVETLLRNFAVGGMTEEQFLQEKNLVFKQLRESKPEHFDQGKIFADNLLEIANKIKEDIGHSKGLANIDIDFDLIIGRAKSGVRTEAQMTALNKIVEKVNNRSWGLLSILINETTVGIGGALAVSLVTTIAKSKLTQAFTFGASVLASGSIAYAKEKWRLGQERKQHMREMTKGKSFEDNAKRREEMEKYRYATRDAKDLIASLARLNGGVEISSGKNLTSEDLDKLKPLAEKDSELAGLLFEYKQQLKKIEDIESDLNSDFMRVKDEKARRPKEEDLIVQKRKLAKIQADIDLLNVDSKHTNNVKPKSADQNKIVDIKEKIKSGEMTPERLNQAIADLADIEARIRLSDQKKIDLISFSSIKDLENERWALDKARANAKCELRKLAEQGKLGLPAGQNFDQHLESLVQALENSTTGTIGKDISEKDKTFIRMKNEKAFWKGARTVGYGLLIGATLQEGFAMLKDNSSGLVEHALNMGKMDKSDGNLTPIASLWSYLTGHKIFNYELHDVPVLGGHMKLPWDMTMAPNPDGTFNLMRGVEIVKDHLKINQDGSLTDEARKALGGAGILSHEQVVQITDAKKGIVSTKDFLDNHSKESVQIHRGESSLGKGDMHFDNNTPVPKIELNEQDLRYGFGGTGINPETGHYSYDIRSMTEGGSFHGSSSLDVIAEAQRLGHPLKMLISLDKNNPFKVFEVLVKPDGTVDIDPNSEVGRLAFKVVGRHLQFNGATAEIAHSLGIQSDGIEKFNIIATQVGKGLSNVEISGPETAIISSLDIPQGTDMPWFVPIMQRTPLEKAKYKEEKEKGKNNVPEKDKIPGKERPIGVEKPPEAVKEEIEKKKSIPAKERIVAEKIVEIGTTIALLKKELEEEKNPKYKEKIQKEIDNEEKELEKLKKVESIVAEATAIPVVENEKKNKEIKRENENPLRQLEKNILVSKTETVEEKKDKVETLKIFRALGQSKNSQEFEKLKKDFMATNAFKREASVENVEDMKEMTFDNITSIKEKQQAFFHGLDLAQKGLEAEIVDDKASAEKYEKELKELLALDDEEKEEENTENVEEKENNENKEESFVEKFSVKNYPRINSRLDKFVEKDKENGTLENANSDTKRFQKLAKDKPEIIKTLESILDPKMSNKDYDKAIKDFNKNKKVPGINEVEQNIIFGNINEIGKSRRQLSIKIAKNGEVYLSPTR